MDDQEISKSKHCPVCGMDIPADAPLGSCPSCLMKLGLHFSPMDRTKAFGKYQLLKQLGRGGMGVVYEALQTRLTRHVALKMILSGTGAPWSILKRFQKEAEVVAKLDHPNIVPIYDVGEQESQPYFSMKLIDGVSLETHICTMSAKQEGAINDEINLIFGSFKSTARFLKIVAEAVHYAHQRGVIHRDIKPSNILVDRRGNPHLTDFGLAKVLEEEGDLTRATSMIGTPSYMAPEMANPDSHPITTSVDIYSLGAVLYALLTLRPPFKEDTPLKTLDKVRNQKPVPPRQLCPDTSPELESICMKCLEKDPARRFPTAAALAEELSRYIRDDPVSCHPTDPWRKFLTWCRRRSVLALTSLFLAVGLVAGAVLVLLSKTREKSPSTVYLKAIYPGSPDTGAQCFGVETVDSRIYLAERNAGLRIVDASRPKYPVLLTQFKTGGEVWAVKIVEDLAYISDGYAGLKVLDISNPVAPKLVRIITNAPIVLEFRVVNQIGYAVGGRDPANARDPGGNGLRVFNLADPRQPELVGSYDTTGNAWSLDVQGKYAYVADGNSGLKIVSVSDPTRPVRVGGYTSSDWIRDVQVTGKYGYLVGGGNINGLIVLDLEDPTRPEKLGEFPTPGNAWAVHVVDGYAYVADREAGLQVIDVSDPRRPVLAGSFDTNGDAQGVQVQGNVAYVADGTWGLVILEIGTGSSL